MKVTNT
jgi:2-oxoglutarate dehydrogenase E1 component